MHPACIGSQISSRVVRVGLAALIATMMLNGARANVQASIVVNVPFEYLRQGTAGVLSITGLSHF